MAGVCGLLTSTFFQRRCSNCVFSLARCVCSRILAEPGSGALAGWCPGFSVFTQPTRVHVYMYGAEARKATLLLSTHPLPSMHSKCDASHVHKPWGLTFAKGRWDFRTSGTAEYPALFFRAVASDLMEICASFNAFPLRDVPSEAFDVAAATGRQPRGASFQAGPSEFGSTCCMKVPVSLQVPEIIDDAAPWPLQGLPTGSRLLSSRTLAVEGGSEDVREVKFGIYRTPEAFLKEALRMSHAFDEPSTSDMCNIRAMQVILEQGAEGVKDLRAKTLAYYRGREAALRAQEEALKATMDPEVREVMKGKNFLLFQEMLRDAGVDDPHLLEDMTKGFKLIGALPPSALGAISTEAETCEFGRSTAESNCSLVQALGGSVLQKSRS